MMARAAGLFFHPIEILLDILFIALGGGIFTLWIALLFRSYQGLTVKIPVLGDAAARQMGQD
jgi:uncharacterized membrane protein